jgi:XPG I-region
MAAELIVTLKAMNVKFVVAPYEADAQLAYLNRIGTISCIISEDSDLLCFGCKRVIYKLNNDATAVEIRQEDFGNLPAMRNWTLERFRQMCILSGCDYLASPPGIGVITSAKLLKKSDAYTVIKSWVAWGTAIKAPKLPPNYTEMFRMAELTFLHQRVYDPGSETLVPLNPFPDGFTLTREISEAIGSDIESHIAKGIALGLVNPDTKLEFNLSNAPGRRITDSVANASRTTVPLNARLYNTSSNSMKLKPKIATVPKPSRSFFKPDPSKSGNAVSSTQSKIALLAPANNTLVTDQALAATPDPLSGETETNSGVVKSFASVVKSNQNHVPPKKPIIVVSKHFSSVPCRTNENREVITIEDDEDPVDVAKPHPKLIPPPTSSRFPKPVQATPFKSFAKKPQQSKISHYFLKPTIPKLSPLTRTDSKQGFSLKRPFKSNLLSPVKKRFGQVGKK